MLMSSGMGIFYSPNSSSILSAVERERYGVVSGFLNLVRNPGNVTSVAFATAIVTATMGHMGYEPTLEAVQAGGAAGVSAAFVAGLRNAYLTMAGLLLVAMVVSAFKFAPFQGTQPAPAPETSRAS
jgi:Na+/melibiose symporter-like transporter